MTSDRINMKYNYREKLNDGFYKDFFSLLVAIKRIN
jgi:hypothetical protein